MAEGVTKSRIQRAVHRSALAVIACAALSFVHSGAASGAIIEYKPEPFIVNEFGLSSGGSLARARADDPSSKEGRIGFRVQASNNWTRCYLLNEMLIPTIGLVDGEHVLEVADDYNPSWPLSHGSNLAEYQRLDASCKTPTEAPPGDITEIPFLLDTTDPLVPAIFADRINDTTVEICVNAFDAGSGIEYVQTLRSNNQWHYEAFSGENAVESCFTDQVAGNTASVGTIIRDRANHQTSGIYYVTVSQGQKPPPDVDPLPRPGGLSVPPMKRAQAVRYARSSAKDLKRRARNIKASCKRKNRTSFSCRVSWRAGSKRFAARMIFWHFVDNGEAFWDVKLKSYVRLR